MRTREPSNKSRSKKPTVLTFIRRARTGAGAVAGEYEYLVDLFGVDDDERPEWGPIEEAWDLEASDFPADIAAQYEAEIFVVRLSDLA
jgi:hypothetical protein